MKGLFDPALFIESTVTEALDTEFVPVPIGEYTAVAGAPKIVEWESKDDPTRAGLKLELPWELDSPEVKALLGRDKITVRQDIMLDLNPSGGMDTGKGKNVRMGKLREAVGLNVPGQPFNFRMLEGRVAKVKVGQRIYEDQIFNEVKGVTALK